MLIVRLKLECDVCRRVAPIRRRAIRLPESGLCVYDTRHFSARRTTLDPACVRPAIIDTRALPPRRGGSTRGVSAQIAQTFRSIRRFLPQPPSMRAVMIVIILMSRAVEIARVFSPRYRYIARLFRPRAGTLTFLFDLPINVKRRVLMFARRAGIRETTLSRPRSSSSAAVPLLARVRACTDAVTKRKREESKGKEGRKKKKKRKRQRNTSPGECAGMFIRSEGSLRSARDYPSRLVHFSFQIPERDSGTRFCARSQMQRRPAEVVARTRTSRFAASLTSR